MEQSYYKLYFHEYAVPELKKQALQDADAQQRLRAAMALARARTDPALAALAEVGKDTSDETVRRLVQSSQR